ncbi:unnamed protein product [Prorocentrum cordatum]|uniref:Dynein heavy chain AAA 5 extension domain-containing protein n=1 Tax=Prorocentrum cordatum TaxID=2364126 RepID=A0ABN9X7U5_9DINO|nr:unnamed protein product [Polarella glacialis]
MLAGIWLTFVIDESASANLLSVLAQELHGVLDMRRKRYSNADGGGDSLSAHRAAVLSRTVVPYQEAAAITETSHVSFRCSPGCLRGPRLPLLLLQTFRPYAMPRPGLLALCELWLMLAGLEFQYARPLAQCASAVWRLSDEAGLAGGARQPRAGAAVAGTATPRLSQLRQLCELAVRVAGTLPRRRGSVRHRSSVGAASGSSSLGADRRSTVSAHSDRRSSSSGGLGDRRASAVGVAGGERRPSLAGSAAGLAAGLAAGELCPEAPPWARVGLYLAFEELFGCGGGRVGRPCFRQVQHLLLISDEETQSARRWWDTWDARVHATEAFGALGLACSEQQVNAVVQMRCWLRADGSDGPRTRGVLVLADSALGKSVCVDALVESLSMAGEPQELRRLNAASLVLDAADAALRPSESGARFAPQPAELGVLDGSGARAEEGPAPVRSVLVHIDGEVGCSLQGGLAAALAGVGEVGMVGQAGLHLSEQSWLTLGPGASQAHGSLGLVLEMSPDASRSLGPDLVALCGVVHLGAPGGAAEEREVFVGGWLEQARARWGDALAGVLGNLIEAMLEPVVLLLFGDVALSADGARVEGDLPPDAPAARVLLEAFTSAEVRKMRRRLALSRPAGLDGLSSDWALGPLPRHLVLLQVRDAFFAFFGGWHRRAAAKEANPFLQEPRPRDPSAAGEPAAAPGMDSASASPGDGEPREAAASASQVTVGFLFALSWGLAPLLAEAALPQFQEVLARLYEVAPGKAGGVPLPSEYSIFDAVPEPSLRHFQHIDMVLSEPEKADLDAYVHVPTKTVRRFLSLAMVLAPSQTHMCLLGPPGSGKSAAVGALISRLPLQAAPAALPPFHSIPQGGRAPTARPFGGAVAARYLSVAPWTPMGLWERVLARDMVPSSRRGLRPALGTWCLCVVDDCHCAPGPLAEAWRFALERGLVHLPGASGAPPRGVQKAGAAGAGPARRAGLCGLRSVEGAAVLLTARSGTAFCERRSLLRHPWLFSMEEVSETDMLNIIGDNISHFSFVKDMPSEIQARKMRYVRLVQGYMLRLRQRQELASAVTLHAFFRLFKSLLCLSTSWLSELKAADFHALMLHELVRETVDRLATGRQRSAALANLAELQLEVFGGLVNVEGKDIVYPSPGLESTPADGAEALGGLSDSSSEDSDGAAAAPHAAAPAAGRDQVRLMARALRELRFATLRLEGVRESRGPPARRESREPPARRESSGTGGVTSGHAYSDVTSKYEELCRTIGHDLQGRWQLRDYLPPLLANTRTSTPPRAARP